MIAEYGPVIMMCFSVLVTIRMISFFFLFFFLQTDTPEEMNGWIKDIASKIQDFRGPSKVMCTCIHTAFKASRLPSV